jgi:hypothetical protein
MAASERLRLLYFLKLALPQDSVDLIEVREVIWHANKQHARRVVASLK